MTKLEYIWIDGTEPTPQLRSKTKVVEHFNRNLINCPVWSFDGSSTNQAPGNKSDCLLKPVRLYDNPLDEEPNSFLVMCEVWDSDDKPNFTNHRFELENICITHSEEQPWFGIEQEYTMFKDGVPLSWPEDGSEPKAQGDYYCGRNHGEDIVKQHLDACITAGIKTFIFPMFISIYQHFSVRISFKNKIFFNQKIFYFFKVINSSIKNCNKSF